MSTTSGTRSVTDVTELDGITKAVDSPSTRLRRTYHPHDADRVEPDCVERRSSGSTEAHRSKTVPGGNRWSSWPEPSPTQSNPDVLSDTCASSRRYGEGRQGQTSPQGEAAFVQEGANPSQGVRATAALRQFGWKSRKGSFNLGRRGELLAWQQAGPTLTRVGDLRQIRRPRIAQP